MDVNFIKNIDYNSRSYGDTFITVRNLCARIQVLGLPECVKANTWKYRLEFDI